jgi:hypothetical protein
MAFLYHSVKQETWIDHEILQYKTLFISYLPYLGGQSGV